MDSDEAANLLLAFLAEEKEEGKEEELAYEKEELRQLVRDMLFRLRRMDLLVLQLLQVRLLFLPSQRCISPLFLCLSFSL